MSSKWPQILRDYWRRVMHSTKKHMSLGAQNIAKTITWARRDNWRRRRHKK